MVKQVGKLWMCQVCSFYYKTEKLAEKCERWCTENQSCNLDIIKHAVDQP